MHFQRNKKLTFCLFLAVFFLTVTSSQGQIRYFGQATIPFSQDRVRPFLAASEDSIASDTLFQVLSADGNPVAYFRKIRTSVCFDNKCRLLKCTLYWNVTGRYLGFELPKGEFLSKAEHKAFTPGEYERLGALLADASSPLRVLSYAELAPQVKTTGEGVDGVSSATAKNVLDYVVEGAAYTTYKMWHVVYGPTQQDVERLTSQALTPVYAMKIMHSPDLDDRIWALNHIKGRVAITRQLRNVLFQWISDANYSLAERAIHAFAPQDMASDTVQLLMLGKFDKTGYSLKKQIVAKLGEAPTLNDGVIEALTAKLELLNGELAGNVLDVLAKHKVTNANTIRTVAQLLNNPNQFVAQKALRFLEHREVRDESVLKKMEAFRLKQ